MQNDAIITVEMKQSFTLIGKSKPLQFCALMLSGWFHTYSQHTEQNVKWTAERLPIILTMILVIVISLKWP